MSRFSRSSRSRTVPTGSRGERATATKDSVPVVSRDTSKHPLVPTKAPEEQEERPGSIGLSISVGHSAEYGRDKFEVSAWCTLPCGADEESRQEMFELCKQDVYSRLTALRQEVVEVFNLPFEEDPEDSTPF